MQEDEANIQDRTGAPSRSITAGAASLLRGQVLKDQGILGRNEIAESHFVKRKLPEERENPVVVIFVPLGRRISSTSRPQASPIVLLI